MKTLKIKIFSQVQDPHKDFTLKFNTKKSCLMYQSYSPNLVSFCKVSVDIKILIRIRIRILQRILISEYIKDIYKIFFGFANSIKNYVHGCDTQTDCKLKNAKLLYRQVLILRIQHFDFKN